MIQVHTHFYSTALGQQREMDVLLPDRLGDKPRYPDGEIPVLYLLHGWGGSHSDWGRMTGIERYAAEKGIAVVMTGTDLSFYTDMKYGYDFYTFMAQELPALVAQFFPALSTRREATFAGGLSMGGYGALKLGILQPERFAAVIGLSAGIDIKAHYPEDEAAWIPELRWAYGSLAELTQSINDLPFQLERQLEAGAALPRFFLSCGQQDFLYQQNLAFMSRFGQRVDVLWHEEPGDHTWEYWDRNIKRGLDWLPLPPMKEAD